MSDNEDNGGKEQDRFLPIANIARIMKKQLPSNAKIAKDAKEVVQECVSEFISFITSEASDKCLKEKRKTINGDDLLAAMSTLGFDDYIEPLKLYLAKYRESESQPGGKDTKKVSAAAPQAPPAMTKGQPMAQPMTQQMNPMMMQGMQGMNPMMMQGMNPMMMQGMNPMMMQGMNPMMMQAMMQMQMPGQNQMQMPGQNQGGNGGNS